MLAWFFSSNIPLYIEKNPVEKLWKVLETELKTYTAVSPKFVFEKIKFKVLHYIQYDFLHQHPEFSKDQVSMFKSLVIISSSNIVTYSNGYIKADKYLLYIKVGATKYRIPSNIKHFVERSRWLIMYVCSGSIPKSQFSISSMNWEKLTIPARATFKNPNFQSLCELGKTGSTA